MFTEFRLPILPFCLPRLPIWELHLEKKLKKYLDTSKKLLQTIHIVTKNAQKSQFCMSYHLSPFFVKKLWKSGQLCLQVLTSYSMRYKDFSSRHCLKWSQTWWNFNVSQRFDINYPPNDFKKATLIYKFNRNTRLALRAISIFTLYIWSRNKDRLK